MTAHPETAPRRSNWLLTLMTATVVVLVLWGSAQFVRQQTIADLDGHNEQQLERFISHLQSQLSRFAFVPELISKNPLWVEILDDPRNRARTDLANRLLEEINEITGAADTYLMDTQGLTLAASNWRTSRPFVGRNFSFRPYFKQALAGKPGRYFALGTTSKQRGYYFSYPLTHAAAVVGVVVLKMNPAGIEQRWSGRDAHFLVTDPDGVVFITTRPEWLYRSTVSLTPERRAEIDASLRYPEVSLAPLPMVVERHLDGGASIVRINSDPDAPASTYLMRTRVMPEADWTAQILAPTDKVTRAVVETLTVASLLFLLTGAVTMLVWQRRRRRVERERFAADAKQRLEREVAERTADLTREVEERRRTEQALRETQDELVQATKLAVLGQLSASISHELNNPLAAIRSYADNARKFLAGRRNEQVDRNLDRISQLTDRMAKISSQLKVFARKSPSQLEQVSVQSCIQAAVEIVRPQSEHSGAAIRLNLAARDALVRADSVQLEQVLVNLLSNAIQAVEGTAQAVVTLADESADDFVLIHVDDSGPGISQQDLKRIFDPFFTTRKAGLGLGLSISDRIVDGMSGRLTVANLPAGGVRFTVALPSAGLVGACA